MDFFQSLASYCEELAPVAGPLLSTVADTANAIDRANRRTDSLRADSRTLEIALLPEPLANPPRARKPRRRRVSSPR